LDVLVVCQGKPDADELSEEKCSSRRRRFQLTIFYAAMTSEQVADATLRP